MVNARFVRIEGLHTPCLVVCSGDELPEELVVDFSQTSSNLGVERREPVTFRLQPSSLEQGGDPVYVEMFDD